MSDYGKQGNSYKGDDYSRVDSNKCGEGMKCQEEFKNAYTNIKSINTMSKPKNP